jgi:hypothetical protein
VVTRETLHPPTFKTIPARALKDARAKVILEGTTIFLNKMEELSRKWAHKCFVMHVTWTRRVGIHDFCTFGGSFFGCMLGRVAGALLGDIAKDEQMIRKATE